MNVLWITNGLLPEATAKLSGQDELLGSGGWILSLAELLSVNQDVSLTIAGFTNLVKDLTHVQGERIQYYALPLCGRQIRYKTSYEKTIRDVLLEVKPDLVHIHGTEYPFSLAALRACESVPSVVSLQGLVSVIALFYFGGLSKHEIRKCITLHDLVRPNLIRQQRNMAARGRYEEQLLREAHNVIGRTQWDRTHTWAINPNARYFYCNETLRKEFYRGEIWTYENCVPHRIFISQGYYPLKGLHILIDALGIVKKHYADVELIVAGEDFTYSESSFFDRLKVSTYGRIIKRRITANGLMGSVKFVGRLNAEGMKKEFIRSNLFICSSSIENSPNSLCEAQILGVPILASYVGGVPDLMKGDDEHLYRFDDVVMLANKICRVFEQRNEIMTSTMRQIAQSRHNPVSVVTSLLSIYGRIIKG